MKARKPALRAAIKAQFPKIGLSFAKVKRHERRSHPYLWSDEIDLPLFDRNQGNIAIARATRKQLFRRVRGASGRGRGARLFCFWRNVAAVACSAGDADISRFAR